MIDDLSDHLPCVLTLKNFQKIQRSNVKVKHRINDTVVNKIKESLIDVNWLKLLENKSVIESFNRFLNILMKLLDKHAPKQIVKERLKKSTCPWMSKGL